MSDNTELMRRFRAAATKFIEAVDSAPHFETEVFLANVGHSMAELYSIALSLPAVEPETTGTNEAPFQTDKWDELHRSLREKLGPLDTYWTIFDFTEKQELCRGVLQETFRRFISTLSKAFTWKKSAPQNLTCCLIGA
jgi:Domain of unknown function (DUF5063)